MHRMHRCGAAWWGICAGIGYPGAWGLGPGAHEGKGVRAPLFFQPRRTVLLYRGAFNEWLEPSTRCLLDFSSFHWYTAVFVVML